MVAKLCFLAVGDMNAVIVVIYIFHYHFISSESLDKQDEHSIYLAVY